MIRKELNQSTSQYLNWVLAHGQKQTNSPKKSNRASATWRQPVTASKLAQSAVTHAEWAAKRYAATLAMQPKDRRDTSVETLKGIMRRYAVNTIALEYAAKKCIEFLTESGQ